MKTMKTNVTLLVATLFCFIFSAQAQDKDSNVELKFYYNFSRSVFDYKFPLSSNEFQYLQSETNRNNLAACRT